MVPVQEIYFFTNKKIIYSANIVKLPGALSYSAEIQLYDAETKPTTSTTVRFHPQFKEAKMAFKHAVTWIRKHSFKFGYTVQRIENPNTVQFLPLPQQQPILDAAGLKVKVQGRK